MSNTKAVEKRAARIYYVEQLKTAKEIAQLCNCTEKTIGSWIEAGGWKKERDARLNSCDNQTARIRELISVLSERSLEIEKQIKTELGRGNKVEAADLREESIKIGDQVSKWNKTLEGMDKENRISLSTYLEIMDDIFKNIQLEHPELHMQLLNFQEKHINTVSLKYG